MSATPIAYRCAKCGEDTLRDNLVVKRVQFREMGQGGKVLITRTLLWLCRDKCLVEDPDWSRPAFIAAPGTDAKREAG